MARQVRPTLRCLREDLGLPVPHVDVPLGEIAHPLLAKAAERFADLQTGHERIRAIDDQVLFKVKIQRWRGAVWADDDLAWLVAAGQREDGSPDDFYAALAARSNAARARYNAEHTPPLATTAYSGYLLPGHEDDLRWRAEAAARAERQLGTIVRGLVRQSLLDGHEHAAMLDGAALGIQVRAAGAVIAIAGYEIDGVAAAGDGLESAGAERDQAAVADQVARLVDLLGSEVLDGLGEGGGTDDGPAAPSVPEPDAGRSPELPAAAKAPNLYGRIAYRMRI